MALRSLGILLFFVAFQGQALPAQEPPESEDPLYLLLDKALRIKVTARVLGQDEELAWNMETTYITISGRTVTIPLKGSNIVVLVHVTPYKEEQGNILLVAEGQVWLTPSGSSEVKYLSTVQSIPIRLGEKILFFPLGMDFTKADYQDAAGAENKEPGGQVEKTDSDLIELQVQILPYQEDSPN